MRECSQKKTAPEFGRRSGPRFGVSVPEQFLHSRYDVRRLAHHIFDDLLQFFTGHGIEIELPLIDISEKLGILHGRVECITQNFDAIRRNARRAHHWSSELAGSKHGSATELSIPLSAAASGNGITGPTVEPRQLSNNQGGLSKIQIDFDRPVTISNFGDLTVVGRTTTNGVMNDKVSTALVGAGYWGKKLLPKFVLNRNSLVRVICDIHGPGLETLAGPVTV